MNDKKALNLESKAIQSVEIDQTIRKNLEMDDTMRHLNQS